MAARRAAGAAPTMPSASLAGARTRIMEYTPRCQSSWSFPLISSLLKGVLLTKRCRYIGMLEQQQASLVAGLQELYRRVCDGPGWSGTPLNCDANGHPRIHDLLTRLSILDHSSSEGERLESRQDTVHFERAKGQNAPAPMQPRDVCDVSSESSYSSIVPARSLHWLCRSPDRFGPCESRSWCPGQAWTQLGAVG
ncbi:hypothetical protein BDV10DRAFT_30126 [Aspergillus recurvatus]